MTTNIKDDINKSYYNEKIKIPSLFFTKSISMKNKLKNGNFYHVESILKNKKENVTDISSYPFKKIKKLREMSHLMNMVDCM